MYKIINNDMLVELDKIDRDSIDSCVCDPPYHIGFMNKKWDKLTEKPIAFQSETWAKVYRVLKPGGYLLSFSGTRTMHKIATAIEEAGFEIKDTICWHYSTGFPHSLNIGKSIDKKMGVEREVIGESKDRIDFKKAKDGSYYNDAWQYKNYVKVDITKGNSIGEGWGTNLKPATEFIIMARKPVEKGLSIAENFMKWGTGGINIDDCRIPHTEDLTTNPKPGKLDTQGQGWGYKKLPRDNSARYPANVIFECICDEVIKKPNTKKPFEYKDKTYKVEGFIKNIKPDSPSNYNDIGTGIIHTNPSCPCYILDKQSGNCKGWASQKHNSFNPYGGNSLQDSETISRFFYIAKASKFEKNIGCEELEEKEKDTRTPKGKGSMTEKGLQPSKNNHCTVKPVKLLEYLVTMVTPKNGTCLDPFMGSGSTGIACINNNFNFLGIEKDENYFLIAKKRLEYWQKDFYEKNIF